MSKNTSLLCILISCCIWVSCHKSVYDPEALERDYFIKNIPENFDWSTTQSLDLQVSPFDLYNGQYPYTIEVFNKNPLLDREATLYAAGWCTGQQILQKKIVVPDVDTSLFIRQTTPGGRRSIQEARIENGRIICNFDPAISIASANKSQVLSKAGNEDIPDEVPSGAIEISGTDDVKMQTDNDYVISGDYSGKLTFPHEGKCSLYITGTWTTPEGSIIIERNSNIYILEKGKLLAQAKSKFILNAYGIVGISPEGQFGHADENNISLQFENQGLIYNEGKLYGDVINAEGSGMRIINKGTFYANLVKSSGNPYSFQDECYANVKQIILTNGSNLYIAPECAFDCKTLEITNSSVKLDNNAMLQAGAIVPANWGQNVIHGVGSKFSLARIEELKANSYNSINFTGKLYVGCKKYPSNPDNYKVNCTYEDIESGATIEIKPSECNPGGNGYVPEEPEKPTFPKKITYRKAYTYASEDNYPSPGDYDMNDLVISMDSISCYYTKAGDDDNISKVTWHMTVRAVGATRRLGAAIQLDELKPEEIKSVNYSYNVPLGNFERNGNGTEKGQKCAVIPLFDNAHTMLGCTANTTTIINTINTPVHSVYNAAPQSFDVNIEFTSPIDEDDVEISEMNYFTIVGIKKPRTEIHLPRYIHTDLANTPQQVQEVTEKFMWTIKVPGYFAYPHEWQSILNAYPDFEKWVQSNRKQYKNWYKNPNKDFLYK